MAKEPVWAVSWLPIRNSMTVGKIVPPRPEQREFPDQTSAVSFVMGLDESVRGTARINIPGGMIIERPVIEQMYADLKSK